METNLIRYRSIELPKLDRRESLELDSEIFRRKLQQQKEENVNLKIQLLTNKR
jgi:hypothetical protein